MSVKPAILCKPLNAYPKHFILYFHGGAFAAGSPSSHRKVVAQLAKLVCSQALIIDYGRAPEHQFPAQIEDATQAFRWLRDVMGIPAENIASAGDSAGGSLSITTALKVLQRGEKAQTASVGLSPGLTWKLWTLVTEPTWANACWSMVRPSRE